MNRYNSWADVAGEISLVAFLAVLIPFAYLAAGIGVVLEITEPWLFGKDHYAT